MMLVPTPPGVAGFKPVGRAIVADRSGGKGDHPKTPAASIDLFRSSEEERSVVAHRGEGSLMEKRSRYHHHSVEPGEGVDEAADRRHREDPTDRGGEARSGIGVGSDRRSSKPEDAGSDYRVGFGRPPLHSRFKKGEVRNPKGRPKGSKNRPKPREAAVIEAAMIRHERDMLILHEREMRGLARRIEKKIERLDLAENEKEFPGIRIDGAIGPDQIKEVKRLKKERETILSDREFMVEALEQVRGTPMEIQFWPGIQHLDRLLSQNSDALSKFRRKI
jgi:hypothetical protein